MKMMTRTVSIALVLTITATTAAFAQKQKASAKGAKAAAAPAPAPAVASVPPQMAAAGIRVTGLGLGANGSELKPFNESPGTAVVVAIQPPKGSGIVSIDDHGSKLDAFNDDKGESLLEEGRVGPFPKIAEDGSAALVELEVRARPSAGASAVSVQGTIALTLAGGSKPVRAANVKLDANQTFKIGATTLTITDPKVEDESTQFTVNLPRSLLTTIREIRFFDAKNAPLEGQRRGSGYFNEKAELELEVKTKEKAVSIEFELWQNLKTGKFPFNLQAGLGVAAGSRGTPDGATAGDKAGASTLAVTKIEAAATKADGPPPAVGANEGAETVDAVLKQMQASALAGKGSQVLSVIYPSERAEYAQEVAMMLAFLPMGSMDDQKAADAMTKELDAFFDKHHVKPPFSRDPAELFKGVDLNVFVSDAFGFIKSHAKKGDKAADMLPVPQGKAENLKVTGDTAVATLNGKDMNFSKIGARWFIRLK